MKLVYVLTAIRVIETGEPEKGQDKEDFIDLHRESAESDPFAFLDHKDTDVSVVVREI